MSVPTFKEELKKNGFYWITTFQFLIIAIIMYATYHNSSTKVKTSVQKSLSYDFMFDLVVLLLICLTAVAYMHKPIAYILWRNKQIRNWYIRKHGDNKL